MDRDRQLAAPTGMVLVPASSFLIGVALEETWVDPYYPEYRVLGSACPQREIYLSDYYIDIYPVTNKQYKKFIDETGHHLPSPRGAPWDGGLDEYGWDQLDRLYPAGTDYYPVVLVSWYDALAYCEWAEKRLPTEAEWEKAARGADGRPYPWGSNSNIYAYGHFYEHWFEAPRVPRADLKPVNAHPAGTSIFGCQDMLGNVQEWCADWFDESYYSWMPSEDPKGPEWPGEVWGGPCKVVRGCGRFDPTPHVAERDVASPWTRDRGIGFRCALSPRSFEK